MKTIKRRAFCKAAAAAVAGVLAPHAAAEALLPQAAQAVAAKPLPPRDNQYTKGADDESSKNSTNSRSSNAKNSR